MTFDSAISGEVGFSPDQKTRSLCRSDIFAARYVVVKPGRFKPNRTHESHFHLYPYKQTQPTHSQFFDKPANIINKNSLSMSILDQIKSNSITELSLSQDADEITENTSEIVDALRNNKSIVSVRFENEFLGDMRNDSRLEVVETLGMIPTLQRVHFADTLLVVSGIAKMLSKATGLRELSISNLILQGIESDFDAFKASLAAHGSLKLFKMEKCRPAVQGISLEGLTTSSTPRLHIDYVPNNAGALTA